MLTRYRHLADPVTGVVPELRPGSERPRRPQPAISPAQSGPGAGIRRPSCAGAAATSGGKGITPAEAEAGALCEAVERFCGTRQGDEAVVLDTLAGLGEAAVHPNPCQLFAERQFRDRDRWNATHSAFQQVPPPFDPRRTVEWTPVCSLTTGRQRLLPTSMLYFSRSGPSGLPWADSNGNAAGSSLEDAIVQGFLELVERDAVALWWYNRTRQPALDLDAFDEPWLAELGSVRAPEPRAVGAGSDLGPRYPGHRGPVPAHRQDRPRTSRSASARISIPGSRCAGRSPRWDNCCRRGRRAGGRHRVRGGRPGNPAWWTRATVGNQPYLLPDSGRITAVSRPFLLGFPHRSAR